MIIKGKCCPKSVAKEITYRIIYAINGYQRRYQLACVEELSVRIVLTTSMSVMFQPCDNFDLTTRAVITLSWRSMTNTKHNFIGPD